MQIEREKNSRKEYLQVCLKVRGSGHESAGSSDSDFLGCSQFSVEGCYLCTRCIQFTF